MRTFRCIVFVTVSLLHTSLFAQDDLMKMLNDEPVVNEKVLATFKTTRIINAQSVETVKSHSLDFRVGHRFGNMGGSTAGHTLFGFDNSTDIRIAFEYGVSDNLTLGFSRSKRNENLEGLVKYKLWHQTTNNSVPFTVVLFSNVALTPEKALDNSYDLFVHRLSYTFQGIIGRKFTPGFSLELLPTVVHRNYIADSLDDNNIYSLGIGGRLKISRSSAIIADYFYNFNPYRSNNSNYYFPLGLGYEIETGGHVFSIMFTNASGIIENNFIPSTVDSWTKGGYKFSFTISRLFGI
jgi:hypothetical protein